MMSVPRAICREQALFLAQDLPGSLMDENTLATVGHVRGILLISAYLGVPQMCHLLSDSSIHNQKMAYQVLQQAAVTRTEHLVVEAGIDSQNMITMELPRELVDLLQSSVNFEGTDAGGQDPLAYLLGWMIVFDLFANAVSFSASHFGRVLSPVCSHLRSRPLMSII